MIRSKSTIAIIDPLGAEVKQLIFKGRNYMWSGDPNFWGRTSPILFPIIGTLKDARYWVDDQPYTLPRHGFARGMRFEILSKTDTIISYRLVDSAETHRVYPYSFQLAVTYEVFNDGLKCVYEVVNPSKSDLYFSLGAHPAFKIEEGYSLYFPGDRSLDRFYLQEGLLTGESEQIALDEQFLKINDGLFHEDAIVLKNLKSSRIILKDELGEEVFAFQFNNFPYFGIWSATGANFLCLEPWAGVADSNITSGKFAEKEGIVKLSSNRSWTASWQVIF